MNVNDLLLDGFSRVHYVVHQVLDDLTPDALDFRLDSKANSIAWLIWHLVRVQDDHVAEVAGREQTWTAQGWDLRFDLPFEASATGYGHGPDEVRALRAASAELLLGYHDAVYAETVAFVRDLSEMDLDRIVDKSWQPPVDLGTRLVSVISDDLQHAGQAAFIKGVATRAGG
jgi:uncharacterized damage-inducible protein DinB